MSFPLGGSRLIPGYRRSRGAPLAEEAVAKPHEFFAQLDWLTTNEAESAGPFGYELGKLDRRFAFEEPIIGAAAEAEASPNVTVLGDTCAPYLR